MPKARSIYPHTSLNSRTAKIRAMLYHARPEDRVPGEIAKRLGVKPNLVSHVATRMREEGILPQTSLPRKPDTSLDREIDKKLDRQGIKSHDVRMGKYMQEVDKRKPSLVMKKFATVEKMIETEEAKVQSLIDLKKKSQAAKLIFKIAELKRAIQQAKNLTSAEDRLKLIEKAVQQFRQK